MLLGLQNGQMDSCEGNPSDTYKRAVMRSPPSRFMVEFLLATKSNGAYHHGMHIAPVISEDGASISSRGSTVEYDIWRRWEDCLWLQDLLEQEYARAAREKKIRLQQGKGVKNFNGIYKQDLASSWESLPPGPDPKSVGQDIHCYLPTLTKKGTLFRASQATIESRQKEFRALVETLFSDDMPALIQEIRASTVVTDFFGLWRRDYDNMDRSPKGLRGSVSSSVFSSYFSESTSSLSARTSRSSTSNETISPRSLPTSPAKHSSSRSRVTTGERPRSISSTSDITEVSRYPQSRYSGGYSATSEQRPRRRAISSASSDSSMSAHSDGSSDSNVTSSTTPAIAEEAPYMFGHNPQHSSERPSSILEIPEERDFLSKSSNFTDTLKRRPRASTIERKAHRTTQIIGLPQKHETGKPVHRVIRESWQTTTSLDSNADEFIEGLGFSLPNPIKDNKYRQSMASISTFMTTDSADAIIRRDSDDDDTSDGRSLASESRASKALTLSDFEIYSECDEEDDSFSMRDTDSMLDRRSFLDARSILESFPRPTSYLPELYRCSEGTDSRPETPTGHFLESLHISDSYNVPPSPTSTVHTSSTDSSEPPASPTSTVMTSFTSSTTASSVPPGSLSLKAAYNSSIILLRVPSETPFQEVRQRLYNKFVGQEGIPLSQNFVVAFVSSAPPSPVKLRKRSASTSSGDPADLQHIYSDFDWQDVLANANGSKLTLRILDPK